MSKEKISFTEEELKFNPASYAHVFYSGKDDVEVAHDDPEIEEKIEAEKKIVNPELKSAETFSASYKIIRRIKHPILRERYTDFLLSETIWDVLRKTYSPATGTAVVSVESIARGLEMELDHDFLFRLEEALTGLVHAGELKVDTVADHKKPGGQETVYVYERHKESPLDPINMVKYIQ